MKTVTGILVIVSVLGITTEAMAFLDSVLPLLLIPEASSISRCHRRSRKAVAKATSAEEKAFQTCADNLLDDYHTKTDFVDTTVSKCISAFRTVNDSRFLGKSSVEKATTQIRKGCEPGVGGNALTLDDVLGGPLALPGSSINAKELGAISGPLGGPQIIDSVDVWAQALLVIGTSKARESFAKTLPNGPEMLTRLGEKVDARVPSGTDPNQLADVKAEIINILSRVDANGDGQLDSEPLTLGAACVNDGDCLTTSCVAGVCKCPSQVHVFNVSSSVGDVLTSALWPGGTQRQGTPGVCDVTIAQPEGSVDLACPVTGAFSVVGFSGYSDCFGAGGEDGDGCQATSCPPGGIGSCCNGRPACSTGLNGSATAQYIVQCVE